MSVRLSILFLAIGFLFSCSTTKKQQQDLVSSPQVPQVKLDTVIVIQDKIVHDTVVLSEENNAWYLKFQPQNINFGLSLYDPNTSEFLLNHRSENLFIPASNTKVITLLSLINNLGDSIAFGKFYVQDSILSIWPLGDPSFLNPKYHQFVSIVEKIRKPEIKEVHIYKPEMDDIYGKGWHWDDYAQGYQPTLSVMPVYSNKVIFSKVNGIAKTLPIIFEYKLKWAANDPDIPLVNRKWNENIFTVDLAAKDFDGYEIPFLPEDSVLKAILEDTLKVKVSIFSDKIMPLNSTICYSSPRDSMLKWMMQESDNFISEQLIVQSILMHSDKVSFKQFYKDCEGTILSQLKDKSRWVDGSGLSRYNLQSPRNIIAILDTILKIKGRPWVEEIFAAGGINGTLKKKYVSPENLPYVFAKSGTLSGVHCLSGYVRTKTGRFLLFSFLYNGYVGSPKRVQDSIESLLLNIYEKY
jgi:D-alanyl-D-alanine carboxypeptidase/D-alanyl-D-alanine-endopeptidase (penicillin-binding protein 4)